MTDNLYIVYVYGLMENFNSSKCNGIVYLESFTLK